MLHQSWCPHTTVGDGVEFEDIVINVVRRRKKGAMLDALRTETRGTLESIARTRASARTKRCCPHQEVRFAPKELKARRPLPHRTPHGLA